jgi:hypothetical protein
MTTRNSNTLTRELQLLRRFVRLLDDGFRIPIIGYRVGLEPLLGLIPFVGDVTGFALSGYLIFRASRLGAPRSLISKMLMNALIDTVIGSIPVLGDIFDFVWKANRRNLELFEQHLRTRG